MKNISILFVLIFILSVGFAQAVQLPDEKTINARLLEVTKEPYLVEKYFPSIFRHAGTELSPEGVLVMFTLANYDLLEGLPLPGQVALQIHLDLLIPEFIRAIFAHNPTEAEETIQLWRRLNQQTHQSDDDNSGQNATQFGGQYNQQMRQPWNDNPPAYPNFYMNRPLVYGSMTLFAGGFGACMWNMWKGIRPQIWRRR